MSGRKRQHRQPWWHEGIRFECQGSGKCCVSRGDYGYVYVTLEDRRRLAAALGIATRQFTNQYCTRTEGLFHLENNEAECRFLDGNQCAVYDGRPTQCRTWPFWPENMKARAWTAIADYCPGVGQGAVIPADEIVATLRRQRQAGERS